MLRSDYQGQVRATNRATKMLGGRRIDSQELYVRIGRLIAEAPDLRRPSPEHHAWVSKVVAVIEATGDLRDSKDVRDAAEYFDVHPEIYYKSFGPLLQRALARAELAAPASATGAFIAAGSPMDAMTAVGKVFKAATTKLLVVDPYMDETILTDFAVMVGQGVELQLLSDAATAKPSLVPSVRRWSAQYGASRPVQARQTAPRMLHDRIIIADDSKVWDVTQSFKDFAARSPASIVAVPSDLANLKVAAYANIWTAATIL